MRDTKTLLRIIIDNVDYYQKRNEGICGWINQSYLENHISFGERILLKNYIQSQKPTWRKNIKFYYDKEYLPNIFNKVETEFLFLFSSDYHEGYWWKIPYPMFNLKGNNDKRINFLNHLFDKL